MNTKILPIFDKDRETRKNGIIALKDFKFNRLESHELKKVYEQLNLIIENDSNDVKFFAKKILDIVKKTASIKNIDFEKNPINEIYEKNSVELLNLLKAEEKITRINALYALAKNGCAKEHIVELEKFAELAPEDEAILAIESIQAIKKFLEEKKEKQKRKLEKRKKSLEIFEINKDKKSIIASGHEKELELQKRDIKKPKFYKLFYICIFFYVLYNIYFALFVSPYKFIPENSVLIDSVYSNFKYYIIYKKDDIVTFTKYQLSLKGWKKIN